MHGGCSRRRRRGHGGGSGHGRSDRRFDEVERGRSRLFDLGRGDGEEQGLTVIDGRDEPAEIERAIDRLLYAEYDRRSAHRLCLWREEVKSGMSEEGGHWFACSDGRRIEAIGIGTPVRLLVRRKREIVRLGGGRERRVGRRGVKVVAGDGH